MRIVYEVEVSAGFIFISRTVRCFAKLLKQVQVARENADDIYWKFFGLCAFFGQKRHFYVLLDFREKKNKKNKSILIYDFAFFVGRAFNKIDIVIISSLIYGVISIFFSRILPFHFFYC